MINALFWSSMLVFSLVAMLLLCRHRYVVYFWPSDHVKPSKEFFDNLDNAVERAKQLREFGYTVIVDEV